MKVGLLVLLAGLTAMGQQRRAPGFSLPDAKFTRYDLQDYKGKVVLIELMRTECPMCRALTKSLAEVSDKFGDKVAVFYIVTPPDTTSTVATYVAEHPMRGPVLFDCGQVAASYTESSPQNPTIHLPQLYVVDGDGIIKWHASGDANPSDLMAKTISPIVEGLLGKVASPK